MLKTRLIPCLDVDNGRVVKGVNFVDLIDAGDPVEQSMCAALLEGLVDIVGIDPQKKKFIYSGTNFAYPQEGN